MHTYIFYIYYPRPPCKRNPRTDLRFRHCRTQYILTEGLQIVHVHRILFPGGLLLAPPNYAHDSYFMEGTTVANSNWYLTAKYTIGALNFYYNGSYGHCPSAGLYRTLRMTTVGGLRIWKLNYKVIASFVSVWSLESRAFYLCFRTGYDR